MLPKKQRLTALEVAHVLSSGRSVGVSGRGAVMSMKYVSAKGFFKTAVVVPKRIARKATERNTLRRVVYRALVTTPLPQSGVHAVFFVRSIPLKAKTETFREEIAVLLKKI